ncbi:MAG: hypothetical protein INR73_28550 [Williamsia sp.]|nr:hypothetical protein [Williamsia sp.]
MNRNGMAWLLPILLLAGCHNSIQPLTDDNRLEGTWTLFDAGAISSASDASTEAQKKNDLDVGSVICLFRDSSFTKTEGNGNFTAGSWHMGGDTDRMMLTTRTEFKQDTVIYIDPPSRGHPAHVLTIARDGFLYRYEKTGVPLADDKNDPFYFTNNRWRLTPHGGEDSTRIKERFANYIKHLALLLKAAKERKETEVSFAFSEGPVTIDDGSIGILPYEETGRSWKNGFYSDEAAAYAYTLYGNYLSQPHSGDRGTGDWMENDYRALMSVYPAFHASRREAVRVR